MFAFAPSTAAMDTKISGVLMRMMALTKAGDRTKVIKSFIVILPVVRR